MHKFKTKYFKLEFVPYASCWVLAYPYTLIEVGSLTFGVTWCPEPTRKFKEMHNIEVYPICII